MNIGLLLEMATNHDEARIVIEDERLALTTVELGRLARRGAAELTDRHTAVVWVAGHGPAFAVALFAAAMAGVPLVPCNYRLADEDLRDRVAAHPGAFVVADVPERLGTAAAPTPAAWIDHLASRPDDPALRPSDDPEAAAVLLATSGTTSTPKSVMLRHRHLSTYVISTVELGSAAATERALVTVPPYHVAGVSNLLSNLFAGRPISVLDPFTPDAWLRLARDRDVTHALVVPTMLARLVEHLDGRPADVPSLRSLAYGGARTPPAVLERALRAFPDVDFVHAYGLTETSSTVAVLGPEDHRRALDGSPEERSRLASAGRPVPGVEVEIRDAAGTVLGPGEPGRLWLRGEQISGEYLGVGSTLDDAGWFDTRDRGRLDHDGYLFIEGRDDDTIIRGAENISPAEIEDVLSSHPGVAEVVVVGLPDDEWGQRIAAVIVPSGTPASAEAVRAWAVERLRRSRAPELVQLWDEIPRTENGKVLRAQVIRRLSSELDQPASAS